MISNTSFLYTFAQPIYWHPPKEGITLEELFVSIGIDLVVVLEAKLKVGWYIHMDTRFVPKQGVRHLLLRLLAIYQEQLPPSAIHGYFGHIHRDVTFITDEDLRRLGHLDLFITCWPSLGYLCAREGEGLDGP